MVVGIIIAVIVVLIVFWAVSAYNGLVTLRNRVKNGWAQIDVQLKQRTDLIPNLVETVKGYAAHESQVFTQVTQARAGVVQAAQSGDVAQRIAAENQLSRALVNLQAVSENYPQLQANTNFMDLQNQLKSLEEKIAYARQFYNDVVQKYNTQTEVVPTNIIAGCSISNRPLTSRWTKRIVRFRKLRSDMHVKPRPMTMGLYCSIRLVRPSVVRPSEGRRSEKEGL